MSDSKKRNQCLDALEALIDRVLSDKNRTVPSQDWVLRTVMRGLQDIRRHSAKEKPCKPVAPGKSSDEIKLDAFGWKALQEAASRGEAIHSIANRYGYANTRPVSMMLSGKKTPRLI